MLPNQSGIQLTTATNKQIIEAEVGEKGKRSLFKCCIIQEDEGLPNTGSLGSCLPQNIDKT